MAEIKEGQFKERRNFPRASIACKVSVIFGERLLVFDVRTANIGVGGMMVVLETKLAYSTVVDLELFLSDKEKPIRCKGQIAWAHEVESSNSGVQLFETGVQFVDLSESDQQEIKKLVDNRPENNKNIDK